MLSQVNSLDSRLQSSVALSCINPESVAACLMNSIQLKILLVVCFIKQSKLIYVIIQTNIRGILIYVIIQIWILKRRHYYHKRCLLTWQSILPRMLCWLGELVYACHLSVVSDRSCTFVIVSLYQERVFDFSNSITQVVFRNLYTYNRKIEPHLYLCMFSSCDT